ncbi:hypothetical protein RvY_01437 [Ramazzottius varieornatus]|uniref:Chitin-binding type-2 domain-containing protein n=1 Tax=Ramazzottius varieornatus TaxID=947166 RepID=A0A1D1UGB0_RAMVA|nr:hypothetical protein RvY_01437 [Ramazzottius varieornatus]
MHGAETGSTFFIVFSITAWIQMSAGWSVLGSPASKSPSGGRTWSTDRMPTAAGENLVKRKLQSHSVQPSVRKEVSSPPTSAALRSAEVEEIISVNEFCSSVGAGSFGNPHYRCKVYHVCQKDGRGDTLPCPQGLRFNNVDGLCDWPEKVDKFCSPLLRKSSPTATTKSEVGSLAVPEEPAIVRETKEIPVFGQVPEVAEPWTTPPNQSFSLDISIVPPTPVEIRTRQEVKPNWFPLTVIPSEHQQVPYRILPPHFTPLKNTPFRRLHPRFHMRFDRHPYKERYIPRKKRPLTVQNTDSQDFINYVRSRPNTRLY